MYMQTEDEFGDVVGKARRGQEIEAADLCRQVGLSTRELGRLESYEFTPEPGVIGKLADSLELNPEKLQIIAEKRYFPLYPSGRPVDGLVVEMMVL